MSETASLEAGKHKEGVGDFIAKTRAELDKTTFPSSDDVKNTTIIVVVSVIFFAAYLYGVDRIWWFILATNDGPIGGVGVLVWLVNKIAGL